VSDSTNHPALDRVLRLANGPESLELLGSSLSGSDATTLLAAMADRAAELSSDDVMRAYKRDRFVSPSELDPIVLARLRLLALESMSRQFAPIELASVAPLGSHSVFSRVSQAGSVPAGNSRSRL